MCCQKAWTVLLGGAAPSGAAVAGIGDTATVEGLLVETFRPATPGDTLASVGDGLSLLAMFDPLYLAFLVPGLLLSFWASSRVKSTFQRYSQVPARSGLSGAEAARELLRARGVSGVRVEEVEGFLSDHYDPGVRVLRLSPDVYHGRSLSALGVAAHEAGHAIQHATAYGPLKFRSWVVKPAQIGSNLGFILAGLGMATQATGMIWIGIVMFTAFVAFTLVTLPVEFDASKRAVLALERGGIIVPSERDGTRAVLNAAAMTYVAAAVSAILQLLYLLMRAGVFSNRDE